MHAHPWLAMHAHRLLPPSCHACSPLACHACSSTATSLMSCMLTPAPGLPCTLIDRCRMHAHPWPAMHAHPWPAMHTHQPLQDGCCTLCQSAFGLMHFSTSCPAAESKWEVRRNESLPFLRRTFLYILSLVCAKTCDIMIKYYNFGTVASNLQ